MDDLQPLLAKQISPDHVSFPMICIPIPRIFIFFFFFFFCNIMSNSVDCLNSELLKHFFLWICIKPETIYGTVLLIKPPTVKEHSLIFCRHIREGLNFKA